MKPKTMKAFKVLNICNGTKDSHCVAWDEPLDAEALALFNSKNTYFAIFEEKKKDASQAKQRLSVVKISHNERTIYRQYAGRGISFGKNIDSTNCVGLSPNSWQQLCLDDDNNKDVVVAKGWWLPFFWNHSNSATRISFRIGVMGLVLAIIGIAVTVIVC